MAEFRIQLPGGRWDVAESVDSDRSSSGREGLVLLGRGNRFRIKRFNPATVNLENKRRKILHMLSAKYDMLRNMTASGDPAHFGGFTWPIFAAYDRDKAYVGYGMINLTGTRPLDHYHSNTTSESMAAGLKDRLKICTILAVLFHIAHEAGLCIGDARPANIHVKRSKSGGWLAYIIDTDSFQVTNGTVLTSDVGADEHSSPRLLALARANRPPGYVGLVRERDDDIHALAVICFQTLLRGHHPFQTAGTARDIARNIAERAFPYADNSVHRAKKSAPVGEYRALPGELRAKFEAAFSRGRYPPAGSWAKMFDKIHAETLELPVAPSMVRPMPRPVSPTQRPHNRLSQHLGPKTIPPDPGLSPGAKAAVLAAAVLVAIMILIALA